MKNEYRSLKVVMWFLAAILISVVAAILVGIVVGALRGLAGS